MKWNETNREKLTFPVSLYIIHFSVFETMKQLTLTLFDWRKKKTTKYLNESQMNQSIFSQRIQIHHDPIRFNRFEPFQLNRINDRVVCVCVCVALSINDKNGRGIKQKIHYFYFDHFMVSMEIFHERENTTIHTTNSWWNDFDLLLFIV